MCRRLCFRRRSHSRSTEENERINGLYGRFAERNVLRAPQDKINLKKGLDEWMRMEESTEYFICTHQISKITGHTTAASFCAELKIAGAHFFSPHLSLVFICFANAHSVCREVDFYRRCML